MRNAFINELVLAARTDNKIVLIVGDLGYSVIEPFADEFPERFFNAGVAEQNMISTAAGLASEGFQVFVYSIGNFPTFRCAEQIRNDIAYHNLPVTVVSVGGGLAYGNSGYSHHAIQDFALMRSFPNMTIAAPGDPNETRACIQYLLKNPGPSYLRLGKAGEENYHREIPEITPGQWLLIKNGNIPNCAILTTGAVISIAQKWANHPDYRDYSIFSLPLWSMAAKNTQASYLNKLKKLLTIEEHLLDGGFGSWLLESMLQLPLDQKPLIECKALHSAVCGAVGSQKTLNQLFGIAPK